MNRQPANLVIGSFLIGLIACMAVTALFWTPHVPAAIKLSAKLQAPSTQFWLGTDEFGRDVVSRLMAGALVARQFRPGALCLAGGGDGLVDILGRALGQHAQFLAGGGIECGEALAA